MWRRLVEAASDSLWRELGAEALRTAVSTLVEEGIEAGLEVWKERQLKIQDEWLDKVEVGPDGSLQRRREESEDDETDDDEPSTSASTRVESADDSSRDRRTSIESLGSYAERQS